MSICREGAKRTKPALSSDVTSGNGHRNETQGALSEHQETPLHCEGDQTLSQVAWWDCGVSILGNTQKLSGHGCRWPCLRRGLGPHGPPQVPSSPNHSVALWHPHYSHLNNKILSVWRKILKSHAHKECKHCLSFTEAFTQQFYVTVPYIITYIKIRKIYLIIYANLMFWKQSNKYESVRGEPVKKLFKGNIQRTLKYS